MLCHLQWMDDQAGFQMIELFGLILNMVCGFLGSIGTISHSMFSDPAEFAKDPQDIVGWHYWDYTDSQYKIGSDDITIQCGM